MTDTAKNPETHEQTSNRKTYTIIAIVVFSFIVVGLASFGFLVWISQKSLL